MLKRKAKKKILITTITIVILFMIYIMPTNNKKINITQEVEYISTKVGYIYLLNDNDLLVKVNVLVSDTDKINDKIIEILNKLINNNTNPKGLKNIIPKKVKVLDVQFDNGNLSISFSKDILKVEESLQSKVIESISYSLFDLDEIKEIQIYVEEENISNFFKNIPEVITRDFGINKMYNINKLKDIQKVVVYYISEVDDNKYLVPVTNYISNKSDKIKVIIESLSSSYIYEPNLKSILNSKTELINYEISDDIMMLNFNNSIFSPSGDILEEVVYTIGNSVFDTYNVKKVVINVENKLIKEIVK